MSDEHKEKLRRAKIGNPKNVGNKKPRTEEQREKIREKIQYINHPAASSSILFILFSKQQKEDLNY